jgi:hypothetical protein
MALNTPQEGCFTEKMVGVQGSLLGARALRLHYNTQLKQPRSMRDIRCSFPTVDL